MLMTRKLQGTTPAMAPSRSCTGCTISNACQAGGYDRPQLSGLRHVAECTGLLRTADYLFRPLSPVRAIYAVRTGMAKTVAVDIAGRELVMAFHLPGEIIGLDALHRDVHENAVIALEATRFCRFPLHALRHISAQQPELPWYLMNAASKRISHLQMVGGNSRAEERCAAFLVDMHDRRLRLGLSADYLPLPMTRSDIGNYLCLTAETMSRIVGRFQKRGLITPDRHGLKIVDLPALRELGQLLLAH